jgi:hypothetical protein
MAGGTADASVLSGPDAAVLVRQLARRVTELEVRLATGKSFIRADERPDIQGGAKTT